MERNNEGLPLFPVFNLKTRGYFEVTQILEDYFLALWGMFGLASFMIYSTYSDAKMTEYTQEGSMRIPWNDIQAHPDNYYDTWDYQFPCRLASPMDLDALEVTKLAVYLTENAVKNPFTFYAKARVESNLLQTKRMEDASPPPPSPTPLHGNEGEDATDDASPPPSPLRKAVAISPSRSPSPAPPAQLQGDEDDEETDEDASPPPLPLTKAVEEDNMTVSPSRSPSPAPPAGPALQDFPMIPSEEPAVSPACLENETSAPIPPGAVPDAAVPDATSVLSVFAQLFPGGNPAGEALLAALTAMVVNSGSGVAPPRVVPPATIEPLANPASVEPPATSEVHSAAVENTSVASSNVEEVGKKRKRGRPAKIHQDATSASASASTLTLDNVASKPASNARRTGGRQRKPVMKGPVLVSDPSAPPSKKVK